MNVKKENLLATGIIYLYMLVFLLMLFCVVSLRFGQIMILFLGSISLILSCTVRGINNQRNFLIFVCFYTLFGLVSFFYNFNMDLQEILWPLGWMSIGILLLNFNLSYICIKILFYGVSLLMFFLIIKYRGIDNLSNYMVASRNMISILELKIITIYAITSHNNNQKFKIFPILTACIISIFTVGRSGILTFAFFVIFFIVFCDYNTKGKLREILTRILGAMGVIYFFYKVFGNFFILAEKNFQMRKMESIRTDFWVNYISKVKLSFFDFLFGANTQLLEFSNFTQNLHNSFIMLHAKYGIVIVIIVVILIFKAMKYFINNKIYLFLGLFVALLFRMQFDYTNFNGELDLILIFFIFYPYYDKREKSILKV